MVSEREFIQQRVSKLAGGLPVRWADERTTKGDFDGREWTLEVFDVPQEKQRELREQLWPLKKAVWTGTHHSLIIILHTQAETDRRYSWVREENRPLAVDSALPNAAVRFRPTALITATSHKHELDRSRVGSSSSRRTA